MRFFASVRERYFMNATRGASPIEVIAATRDWLERVVIGLDLCPFARAVHLTDRVRYSVSEARAPEALLADLERELRALDAASPAQVETSLLVHPSVLGEFLEYNDFLEDAEALLDALELPARFRSRAFTRAISSPAPRPMTSRTTPTARRTRCSIFCANQASSGRSRACPIRLRYRSAISRPCAAWATPAGARFGRRSTDSGGEIDGVQV